MLNLIRMDLYRFLKSKLTWILVLAAALTFFGFAFLLHSDVSNYAQNATAAAHQSVQSGTQIGIYSGNLSPKLYKQTQIPLADLFSNQMQSKLLLLFILVFSAFFVSGISTTGFIKNIAGQVRFRWTLIVSNLIAMAIFTLILFIGAWAAFTIGCELSFGYVDWSRFGGWMPYYGVEFLLHIAFGAVMICLVTLLKNTVISVLIGVLSTMGLLQLLNPAIKAVFHLNQNDFSILKYVPSGNIALLPSGNWVSADTRALLIGIIFLAISSAISMLVLQIRDVA